MAFKQSNKNNIITILVLVQDSIRLFSNMCFHYNYNIEIEVQNPIRLFCNCIQKQMFLKTIDLFNFIL